MSSWLGFLFRRPHTDTKKSVWMWLVLALLFGGGLVVFSVLRPMKQTAGEAASSAGVVLGTPLQVAAPTRRIGDLSELPKGAVGHVDVVYFHRTERCTSCLNAESYTRETVEKYFADQVQRGQMSFQVYDVGKAGNAALARKFDAAGSSLHLGVLIEGTEYLCPVQDIWLYTTNKYVFIAKLKEKLASLVESW